MQSFLKIGKIADWEKDGPGGEISEANSHLDLEKRLPRKSA